MCPLTPAQTVGEQERPGGGVGVGWVGGAGTTLLHFWSEFFLFLKSPQLKEGLLPPSGACHVGRQRPPRSPPSLGWALRQELWFHFGATGFTFGQEGKERQSEDGGRTGGSGATSSAADPGGLPPAAPGLTLLGPGAALPLGVKVKGSRSSALVTVGGASSLLPLGSFPQAHPLQSGAESQVHWRTPRPAPQCPQWEWVGQGGSPIS